jgi:ubiquinone/menaquinone biosynthesis C-methylase UbiE
MGSSGHSYVPAAGSDWLLPFYDLLTKLLGADRAHRRLLEQASIGPDERVLEIGCGTGNLAILAKRVHPSATVVGIDPDPKALGRARKKASRAGLEIDFREAFTEKLPFEDGSIQKVLSAFMLHHIQPDSRLASLREVRRVLALGGVLHLADFEHEDHPRSHRGLHGGAPRRTTRLQGGIADLMRDAGFGEAHLVSRASTLLGTLAFYAAIP